MKFLKRLFCDHDYKHMMKIEKYSILSGEQIDVVCQKCGKIKYSYFREYEGNGYK